MNIHFSNDPTLMNQYEIKFVINSVFHRMLMEYQAVEIYKQKISAQKKAHSDANIMRRECKQLANRYGLTVRAIQDVWKRRSWAFATSHLWMQEDDGTTECKYSTITAAQVLQAEFFHPIFSYSMTFFSQMVQLRRPGRPRGAKDRKPRSKDQTPLAKICGRCHCAAEPFEPSLITANIIKSEIVWDRRCCADDSSCDSFTGSFECKQEVSSPFDEDRIEQIDPFHDDWAYW